jgi:hypothetical protein
MIMRVKPHFNILGLTAAVALCGCASVLDQDGALTLAPYHIENSGRIVVEAHVDGQGPFRFALDTAASISAVFDNIRYELELEPIPGKAVIVHGAVSSEELPLVDIGRIEVGREVWTDPRVVSIPGETAAGASFNGILGIDFMRRYAVGFSTRDRVVRLYPPELVARRSYRGWASVPLEAEPIGESGTALYFFEIEIDGRKIPAVFDLGAGLNVINWAAARRLGFAPVGPRDDDLFSGVLESTPVVAGLNAEKVTTASVHWRNETFSIADLKIFTKLMLDDSPAAILGSGLFTQRDFVIDFVRSRLLVKVAMDEVNVSDSVGAEP